MGLNKHLQARMLEDLAELGVYGNTVEKVKDTLIGMQLHHVIKDEWLCPIDKFMDYAKEANDQKAAEKESKTDSSG